MGWKVQRWQSLQPTAQWIQVTMTAESEKNLEGRLNDLNKRLSEIEKTLLQLKTAIVTGIFILALQVLGLERVIEKIIG